MRSSLMFAFLFACQPRGAQDTGTKIDEGGDADADADADSDADADGDADSDADADGDADSDSDSDTDIPVDCTQVDEVGPWAGHPIAESGSAITRTPYTVDAGIDDLVAATVGQFDRVPVNIPISGAIVTSRGYVPDPLPPGGTNTVSFWFEDANAAMTTFIVDIGFDPNELFPGDEVAFTATEVTDFFGTLEVTAITDFEVLSTGNDVHVVDGMAGPALSYDTDGMKTVELWGGLVAGPTDCGGVDCYDLDYGGNTIVFRTESAYTQLGDCVHFIGPLGVFDSLPQIQDSDFDWVYYY